MPIIDPYLDNDSAYGTLTFVPCHFPRDTVIFARNEFTSFPRSMNISICVTTSGYTLEGHIRAKGQRKYDGDIYNTLTEVPHPDERVDLRYSYIRGFIKVAFCNIEERTLLTPAHYQKLADVIVTHSFFNLR